MLWKKVLIRILLWCQGGICCHRLQEKCQLNNGVEKMNSLFNFFFLGIFRTSNWSGKKAIDFKGFKILQVTLTGKIFRVILILIGL